MSVSLQIKKKKSPLEKAAEVCRQEGKILHPKLGRLAHPVTSTPEHVPLHVEPHL